MDYAVNKRKLCCIVRAFLWDLVRHHRKVVDRIITVATKFQSAIRPNRTFERRLSMCKHPIGYRKNWMVGIA
ncbi:MAG: hypothetical protein LBC12_01865 [Nitrososphaerota archaeon]|nr:hypothetical protein [Nitrososphaerota archaeon]